MTAPMHTLLGPQPLFFVLLGLLGLCGCGDRKALAEVGKARLHQADLEAFASARSHARPDEQSLAALAGRELLAEGARRAGLEEEPGVQSRLQAARREVLAEALLERRLAEVTTEAALRERYGKEHDQLKKSKVHVQQLVVLLPPGAPAQAIYAAKARASQLYAKALAGADFAELAKAESEDAATRERGGDLGWVEEGQVAPVFFEAAHKLHRGQTSELIQTAFGIHLLRAVEDPQEVVPTFEEARGRLAAEARREGTEQLEAKLRTQIEVRLHPERLPTPAGGGQK